LALDLVDLDRTTLCLLPVVALLLHGSARLCYPDPFAFSLVYLLFAPSLQRLVVPRRVVCVSRAAIHFSVIRVSLIMRACHPLSGSTCLPLPPLAAPSSSLALFAPARAASRTALRSPAYLFVLRPSRFDH